MTTDQVIALSASIGTCIAAIATLITIRQMKQQREASYFPELVISQTLIHGISSRVMPTLLTQTAGSEHITETTPLPSMPLINVGLGTAKKILISWSFQIEELISQVNAIAQKTSIPVTLTLEDGVVSVQSEILGSIVLFWKNQQLNTLDYVLPASVEREPAVLKLPPAFITLSSILLFLSTKERNRTSIPTIPSLFARLEYNDIADKKHNATFEIKTNVNAICGGNPFVFGFLESTKRA